MPKKNEAKLTEEPTADGVGEPIPESAPEEDAGGRGMTEREAMLTDMNAMLTAKLSETERRIRRLEAIANQSKARAYDVEEQARGLTTVFLRYLGDPADPVVEWGTERNVSYVDEKTGQLVEDIRYWLRSLSGERKVVNIREWNAMKPDIVHAKVIMWDRVADVMKLELSDDGGRTFVGKIIEIPVKFVNPG